MRDWAIDTEGSSIVVEARSSMGPIAWEVTSPRGSFQLAVEDEELDLSTPPSGELSIDMTAFRSGNKLYDAELAKRLDVRRHPTASVKLVGVQATAGTSVQAHGELTIHGVVRPLYGSLDVEVDEDVVTITGTQSLDIREFGIPAPQMLMLKIFPDVRIHLFLRGTLVNEPASSGQGG